MANTQNLKQIISEEYMKCAMDVAYFLTRYCVIQHPKKGKIPFHLFPFQETTVQELLEHRWNIILKSRQLGISTLVGGLCLHQMLFKSDFNILVIAVTQDVAKNLVTKVRIMHENLPSWLRGTTIEDNKLSLKFANGSQIKAVSSAGTSGRSEALSLLVIDEAAFIQRIDDIWASSQQALATGGGAIILSTPNGSSNFFHDTWVEATTGTRTDDLFHTIKLPWHLHPERNQAWRDEQDVLLGPKLAAQECDCDFMTSGNTVVDGPVIDWYERTNTMVCEPLEKRGPGGDLWVWRYPDYSRSYEVIVDVARGDGNDYSTIQVIDIEACEQVAEFKSHIGTTELGYLAIAVATEYNNALLVVENTGIGWATIQVCLDRNYANLYYSYKDDGYVDNNKHLRHGYDIVNKDKMVPGFTTSTRTRPIVVSKIELNFRERTPIIHSMRLIHELKAFSWINGKAQASGKANDDLIMAFGIGLYIRDTSVKLRQAGIELTVKTLSNMGKSTPIYQMQPTLANGWSMPTGQENESLTWLL